jgi:hypothetical protein
METAQIIESERVEISSVNWRAIFAGAFVALLVYGMFLGLGIAIGGAAAIGVIERGGSGQGLGIGSAIWMMISVLVSIFLGAYAAGRVSGLIAGRVGRVQGAVIAALFFGLLFSQVGSGIGMLGRGLGSAADVLGGAAGQGAQNPQVQQAVRAQLGNLNLKSPPEVVAQGLLTRIVGGDLPGARNYLAGEAGISPAEADQKIRQLSAQLTDTLRDAGAATARAVSAAGWTIFAALLLGSAAGVIGGGMGARASLARPAGKGDRKAIRDSRAA